MNKLFFILSESSMLKIAGSNEKKRLVFKWVIGIILTLLYLNVAITQFRCGAYAQLAITFGVFAFSVLIGRVKKGILIDNIVFFALFAVILVNTLITPMFDLYYILIFEYVILLGMGLTFTLNIHSHKAK